MLHFPSTYSFLYQQGINVVNLHFVNRVHAPSSFPIARSMVIPLQLSNLRLFYSPWKCLRSPEITNERKDCEAERDRPVGERASSAWVHWWQKWFGFYSEKNSSVDDDTVATLRLLIIICSSLLTLAREKKSSLIRIPFLLYLNSDFLDDAV